MRQLKDLKSFPDILKVYKSHANANFPEEMFGNLTAMQFFHLAVYLTDGEMTGGSATWIRSDDYDDLDDFLDEYCDSVPPELTSEELHIVYAILETFVQ